ncbi:Mu-like prophage major head subunit gpT family protein [Ralstonia solanacearum]|uniref:Mu-like prophage major head subunit gpT family protein n=1 Tax=Ralstonia solanacearum TaxID=305 RepID=UPI000501EAEE|nr:Mu-like prophage major head subunit gpT family protein [Ralstonia solanacearum]KFX30684.1 Mu-like prophage FluMu major head subunit gpT [Ralstonia solanacearum]
MGALTQAQLDQLKTTLIARWNAGLVLTPEDWKKIAKLVTSTGKSNTYEWLSQFPAFREWVGARLHKKFKETAYQVVNRKFECTVDVQRTDIEDDEIGQYGTIAESAGQSATDLKNDLVFQALGAGFASVCYDGQYFFDTDHPVYENEDGTGAVTNVSNMQDGAGAPWVLLCTKRAASPIYLQQRMPAEFNSITSTQNTNVFDLDVYSFGGRWRGEAAYGFWQCAFGSKAALNAANFNAAYEAMMKFRGDGQRKLGIVPDTLLCGPDNMADAEALLKAAQNANGSSNTNYNKVELVVTPWL